MCAESWVDPIGDVEPNQSVCIPDNDKVIDLPDEMCDFDHQPEEARKKVIEKLQHNVTRTTRNRVDIRRRECFNDFVDARRKNGSNQRQSSRLPSLVNRQWMEVAQGGSSLQVSFLLIDNLYEACDSFFVRYYC